MGRGDGMNKWTIEELEESLKVNIHGYGEAIGIAALFLKLYGRHPKIGLSGAQAEMAEGICEKLPDPISKVTR